MDAVILAAGQGTRLGELGQRIPKPLLYLPGGTLLEYQLALLEEIPASRILVVVAHEWQQVSQQLRDRPQVQIVQQKAPFTLVGALVSIAPFIHQPALVLHGDNYFADNPANYLYDEPANLFLHDAGSTTEWANAGAYRLEPAAFHRIATHTAGDALQDVVDALIGSGLSVGGQPAPFWRRNVNTRRDLLTAQRFILDAWERAFHPPGAESGYGRTPHDCEVSPPVWIDPRADVAGSHIGPYVTIGLGAQVRDARLREAIVFPHSRVRDRAVIEGLVVGEVFYPATYSSPSRASSTGPP